MDTARAHLGALPWWRSRARTNAQWRLEQAELHALRWCLHACLVVHGDRDGIITAAELAPARPPERSAVVEISRAYERSHEKLAALIGLTRTAVRSHSPEVGGDPRFTEEKFEALHECIDSKRFGYFFTTYTNAEDRAAKHGHRPSPAIEAWREVTRAPEKLATLIVSGAPRAVRVGGRRRPQPADGLLNPPPVGGPVVVRGRRGGWAIHGCVLTEAERRGALGEGTVDCLPLTLRTGGRSHVRRAA